VQDGHIVAEAGAEAGGQLGGEGDLRDQHQRAPPPLSGLGNQAQVHLRLPRPGDPLEHEGGVASPRVDQGGRERGQSLRLMLVQHRKLRPRPRPRSRARARPRLPHPPPPAHLVSDLDQPRADQPGHARRRLRARIAGTERAGLDQPAQQGAVLLVERQAAPLVLAGGLPGHQATTLVGQAHAARGGGPLGLGERRAQHLAEGSQVVAGRPAAKLEDLLVDGGPLAHHLLDVPHGARRRFGVADHEAGHHSRAEGDHHLRPEGRPDATRVAVGEGLAQREGDGDVDQRLGQARLQPPVGGGEGGGAGGSLCP
jgi:hypothetical protein